MPVRTSTVKSLDGLIELQEQLEDLSPLPPEHELKRWLVASEKNVQKAEATYRKSLVWRRQKGIDRILDWKPPLVLQKYYPGGFCGFDREGCPVWIIPFGKADMKGMLTCASVEEFIDFTLKIVECSLELMRKKSLESAKPVHQHVFIFDLEGFSLKAATHGPTLEILQRLISIYEANYPETLKAAYVLNASSFFQFVFKIVQSTVQQTTLNKITVFGEEGWKQILKREIPVEVLPKQWGGTNTKRGKNICMGGEVDQETIDGSTPQELTGMGEIHNIRIEAGMNHVLTFTTSQYSDLRWKFKSEGGDLMFKVEVKRNDENVVLVPHTRVPSNKEVQAGVVDFNIEDTVMVYFDNIHSRFTSKTVNYSIIAEPHDISNWREASAEELVNNIRGGLVPSTSGIKNVNRTSSRKSKKYMKRRKS